MTKVIYHNADFDGIFCREIAKKFLGEKDIEYIGWNYGDLAPAVAEEDKLYILDLSIDELMSHPKLIWIDHHKTAIDKYPKKIPGYRIDGVAACRLAWQWWTNDIANNVMSDAFYLPTKEDYINRHVTEPYAVRLAGEYDVWDKRDNPNTDLFQFGLRSQELDAETWKALLDIKATIGFAAQVQRLIFQGKGIQFYQQNNDASIIKRGFTYSWEGLTFLILNTPRCNSLSFTAGIKPEHDALLGFYFDGTKWNVSLYRIVGKDHDLSKIAVKYGGGGHKQACGFNCKELPFKL